MTKSWSCLVTLLLVLVGVGCAAKTSPAQLATAPVATTRPAAPAPDATSGAASEDAAWQQVVSAAQKEGRVVIYGGGNFSGDVGPTLAREFGNRYGIQVQTLILSGRTSLEKIKLEQAMKIPVADMIQGGTNTAMEATGLGITQSVWKDLPSLREKDAFIVEPAYSPGGEILSYQISVFGPLINTNLVKPADEPKSYSDFLDPKWKGKIIIEDPRAGSGGGFTWFSTFRYLKILDDDYWRKLGPQMVMYGGSSTYMYQLVGRGEYAFSPVVVDTTANHDIAEGSPVKMLQMKEGNYVQPLHLTVIKNAPHPNAARVFINWMFSKEGQSVYARVASLAPLRKDVPDFSPKGAIGKPLKPVMGTWESNEAILKMQEEGIPEKLFGKK